MRLMLLHRWQPTRSACTSFVRSVLPGLSVRRRIRVFHARREAAMNSDWHNFRQFDRHSSIMSGQTAARGLGWVIANVFKGGTIPQPRAIMTVRQQRRCDLA